MGVTAAATAGAMVGLGITLILAGMLRRVPPSTAPSTGLWTRAHRWWTTQSLRRRAWFAGALIAGVVTALVGRWPLAVVLVPVLLVVVPLLLTAPPSKEIEVLAGLDRWVRLLATSLSSGRSIRDAILATRRQVPEVLREPVARLCLRLDQLWTLRDALYGTADDLGSADADAVIAALSIAASRGGAGARATLGALSDSIQDRLRALREVSAERAKPRAVVRQVTIITLGVLMTMLLLNPRFFAAYATPVGQAIAAVLAATYLGCLAILRRKTVPPMAPRFLRSSP